MAKNKLTLSFPQFEEYAEKLDELGGDLKAVTERALQESADYVTDNLSRDIKKHRDSGYTEKSLLKNQKVVWNGMTASIDVGFDISNGGLPSIFLMYGTPRHGPIGKNGGHPGTSADKQLFNDVYGSSTKRKVGELQKKIFDEEISKIMR